MDPRFYLRLAPYAVILALCLSLWGTYNWGSAHKAARKAAESALVTLHEAYKSATIVANNLRKERENAIAEAVTQASRIEREAAAANESRLRSAVAVERRDAGRLRVQLTESLGRACGAFEDSPSAIDIAATSAGDVLAEALRVQAELTGAAERHAGEVRALQSAWPR
jgi:hypothetical protein